MILGTAARVRRALYGRGILRAQALPRPVVSVGNLSVGGTGKTPHVRHIARWALKEGLKPAILSRGYGRKGRGVVVVSDGRGRVCDPLASGDEPALLARALPSVPVVVGESRRAAGEEALRISGIDLFLLDDGFQHLALRREADILLVDAKKGLGNGLTIPFGPLREPPEHARFADALIVTRCADAEAGAGAAAAVPFPPDRPRAFTRLVPRCLTTAGGEEIPLPPAGTEVTAFSGLADNAQFLETIRGIGLSVRRFFGFGDHHWYAPGDLRTIEEAAGGSLLLTTEKDRIRIASPGNPDVLALRVDVSFLAGEEILFPFLLRRIGKA